MDRVRNVLVVVEVVIAVLLMAGVLMQTPKATGLGGTIGGGDGGLGGGLDATGRLIVAGARLPVVPLVILAAVILTLVVGLVAPGVFR